MTLPEIERPPRGGLSEIAQLLYLRGKSTLPFSAPAKQTQRAETCGEEWKCGWEWNDGGIYAHKIKAYKAGVVAEAKRQNRVRCGGGPDKGELTEGRARGVNENSAARRH